MSEQATLERRFWAKVNKTETCWLWTAALNPRYGYGQFRVHGKTVAAHRIAYSLLVGSIPAGMVLDHICHTPACVNPAHLNPVTHRENLENRRGANATNSTGVRGVGFKDGCYFVQVQAGGRKFTERHPSLESAAARALELRLAHMTNNLLDRKESA